MNIVAVTLDGQPRHVPRYVSSWASLCVLLGVPEGHGLGLKTFLPLIRGELVREVHRLRSGYAVLGAVDEPDDEIIWWEFVEGDQYKSIDPEVYEMPEKDPLEAWQTDPDAWLS